MNYKHFTIEERCCLREYYVKGMEWGPRLFYGAGYYSLSPVADVRRTTGQIPREGAYNKEFY